MFTIKDSLNVDIPTIVSMDVGAMEEGVPRYAPLVDQALTMLIAFEPQHDQYEKLCASAPASHRYFSNFLGHGGPAKFYVTRYPGCSSIYEPDPTVIDLFSTIGAGQPKGNFHVVEIVRDFSDLVRLSNDQLVKLAVILHEVYASIDLVAYLLAELDRRTTTSVGAVYLQKLQNCTDLTMKFLNIKKSP